MKYQFLNCLIRAFLIILFSVNKPTNSTYNIENSIALITPTSSALFCHHLTTSFNTTELYCKMLYI